MRSTSFQDQGARFSFYISRRRIEKRRIFPKGRRGGKNPAHQQNQTVAGRVCLNGDFRRLNMLESYSLSLPKFFFSPSFSFSVPLCGRDCRLPGCTEVCEITVLRSSSALPERRQSSGSLWHPHSPHTSANLVLIRPFFLSPWPLNLNKSSTERLLYSYYFLTSLFYLNIFANGAQMMRIQIFKGPTYSQNFSFVKENLKVCLTCTRARIKCGCVEIWCTHARLNIVASQVSK